MTLRQFTLGSVVACCMFGSASTVAAVEALPVQASFVGESDTGVTPLQANVAAYRHYAQAQANGLVAMTKILVREIKAGDVDAAQSVYAPAHRYLARLAPISKAFEDLYARMDASSDGPDPARSGFHRIEYALFAKKSAADLSADADRLLDDALQLQKRIATLVITPDVLVNGPGAFVGTAAARTLAGGTERYSRTDLWIIEANVDGTREIFSLIQPQIRARDPELALRIAHAFAATDEQIAASKDGCGFKTFDALADKDKKALAEAMTALGAELSRLGSAFAIELSLAELQRDRALR